MKETKELVLFVAALASQIVESSTDGDGLNFKDAPEFLDEVMKAPEAFAGVSLVPGEIRNASPEERAGLYSLLSDEIQDLTPARFDVFVAAAEQIAIALDAATSEFKNQD